ncbi:PB1 domain-containing protein [Naegleria gruberi]|uniref:PB1 domain-containing protein n=1 Tax=Naegleria gruberi TaxID=5762 RepID=D2VCK7_NAEGR|nr:PB1 domain-containing protein [Naegleria gruberi]EFC45432.1 PB1 domain-containing protein [Naegleria gruberi]|eukprot:XP_002678176.1 PB1 domain-containing protein [Naegleria gruberi strain NEG-M]
MFHPQQIMYNNYGVFQQLSVKVKLNDTIRRFSVPSSCTLIEFYQQVSKAFQLNIDITTHLVQYKDNEDDLIVTTSEDEWNYAKKSFSTPCMQVTLKEKVIPKKKEQPTQPVKKEIPITTPPTATIQPQPITPQKPSSPQKQPESPIQPTQPIQPKSSSPQPVLIQPSSVTTQQQPTHPTTATVMEDSMGFVALNTSQQPTPFVARFSSDVNLPDGSSVYINQEITKTWKIVNPGSTNWPSNVQLHCRDSKALPFQIVSSNVPVASPNQSVDVSVTFIPRKLGPLKGYFKLCSGDIQFGHTFWLDLVVHPLPVAEAPQQQQQSVDQTIQQVRDLKIDDIREFDSDDEDSDEEDFEDERFNALKEKYQFQLDVLSNMGMTNERALVDILEQNGGDVSQTIQQFILLSSKMQ